MVEESDDSLNAAPAFDFINKELTGAKLTSKLLTDLLLKEEKRKVMLDARAIELERVTKVNFKERTTVLYESIKNCIAQTANLRTQVTKVIREKLPNKCDDAAVFLKLDQIDQLEKMRDYILVVYFITCVSNKVNSHLLDGNQAEAITMLNQLQSLNSRVLVKSNCAHLSKYSADVVETWELVLNEQFTKHLVKWVEKVGWPSRIDTANPTADTIKKFQNTIRCLARLNSQIPKPLHENSVKPFILYDYPESSQLVKILIKPLRKRFRYHFCSSKSTADDTKPEWYFTQVKHWIRDLVPFLGSYVEAVRLSETGDSTILEFVQALSELLILKTDGLLSVSPRVDDVVFSKILEESIRFESETKTLFEDLKVKDAETAPGFVNTLFSQPHILLRWLLIEKRGSLEKLDILFSSHSAWNRVVTPGPTEIGELFIMMLRFIVDRFAHLHQPGQKIQFIQLLIEILDDFRIRCLQIWNSKPEIENLDFLVAETLGYVHRSLDNWQDKPFFASLDFFWETIRKVEKEDLETRVHQKPSRVPSEEESKEVRPKKGLFTQAQERYATSMEMLLLAISQK